MVYKISEIKQAIDLLLKDELLILPASNSYYFGTLPKPENILKMFTTKNKNTDLKPIYLFHSLDQISDYTAELSKTALSLINTFMPGSLTLILKSNGKLEKDTIAVQIPFQKEIQSLIAELNTPLAITSANPNALPSSTTLEMVEEYFKNHNSYILNIDKNSHWSTSTILDLTDSSMVKILKPGSVSFAELEKVVGKNVLQKSYKNFSAVNKQINITRTQYLDVNTSRPTVVLATKEKLKEIFGLDYLDYFIHAEHGKFKLINLGSQTNLESILKNLHNRIHEATKFVDHEVFLLNQNWGNSNLADAIKYNIERYTNLGVDMYPHLEPVKVSL